jgi:hypothetical protein
MNALYKENLLAEIQEFKKESLKLHLVQNLVDCCPNTDIFDYHIDADGRVYWMKAQTSQLWEFWQSAKVNSVPKGYKMTKKPKPLIGNPDVDFSQAPNWAKYWLKDGYSKKCLWSNVRPRLDTDLGSFLFPFNHHVIDAPDFGFKGDWKRSMTSRKAMEDQVAA